MHKGKKWFKTTFGRKLYWNKNKKTRTVRRGKKKLREVKHQKEREKKINKEIDEEREDKINKHIGEEREKTLT